MGERGTDVAPDKTYRVEVPVLSPELEELVDGIIEQHP